MTSATTALAPEIDAVEVRGVRKIFAAVEGADILTLDGISLTEDTKEGFRSFVEKRKPRFTGR